MQGRVKTILTIGEDAPAIAAELSGVAPIEPCGALPADVRTRSAGPKSAGSARACVTGK